MRVGNVFGHVCLSVCLCIFNKVKVTHQGEGHMIVKVKYLLLFQIYVKFYLF